MKNEKEIKTFCLFDGRHELPENSGAIASGFDFETKKPIKTALWYAALMALTKGGCRIIVTGLTPVLTDFIREAVGVTHYRGSDVYAKHDTSRSESLVLLHFDSQKKEYWEQKIF